MPQPQKKRTTNRRTSYDTTAYTGADKFRIFLLLFTVAIIPLIVQCIIVPQAPEAIALVQSNELQLDVFAYYKSALVIGVTILLGFASFSSGAFDQIKNPIVLGYGALNAIILVIGIGTSVSYASMYQTTGSETFLMILSVILYTVLLFPVVARICAKELNKLDTAVYILALAFAELILLSAAFSEYKHSVLYGQWERYENIFVLLGYIILFLEAWRFITNKARAKIVLYGILFSAAVICVIGTFQYAGMDFFVSAVGMPLIQSQEIRDRVGPLSQTFTQIYSTLYNPNSVGLYTAMIFPFTLIAGAFWHKKSPVKYIMLAIAALSVVCLFGANTSGGLAGFVVATVVGAVIVFIYLVKQSEHKGLYIGGIFVFLAAVVCVAVAVPQINSNLSGMAQKFATWNNTESPFLFTDIQTDGNRVEMKYNGGSLNGIMSINEETNGVMLNFTDADGNEIPAISSEPIPDTENSVSIVYADKTLGQFTANGYGDKDLPWFSIQAPGSFSLLFTTDPAGNIAGLTQLGRAVEINNAAPSIGLEGKETFASSRGYIWSRSLPMILRAPILGFGPDTFMVAFPQSDLRGKTWAFGNPYMTVDKAHNIYLQTAVSTGVPSLIAMLGIFVCFFMKNLKVRTGRDTELVGLRLGAIAGICGYLVAGMATDGTVSVSPVFWVLLALGFAVAALDKPVLKVVSSDGK